MNSAKNRNQYSLFVSILFVWIWSLLLTCTNVDGNRDGNWINHGGDIYNMRYAEDEVKISPKIFSKLKLKWEFFAGRDITATPAIIDGILYFPSWNGNIYAVKARDGSLVWPKNLTDLTRLPGSGFVLGANYIVSRATPTVAGEKLLIGVYGPAMVIALKRTTGALMWSTQLDHLNSSLITMSGTVWHGYVSM